MRRLLAVLVLLPLLGSDSTKEYDDRTEYAGIQGTWQLIESRSGGLWVRASKEVVCVYRNGGYVDQGSDGHIMIQGTYRIDSTQSPPSLDHFPAGGGAHKWIYRVDGDTLRMACRTAANQRPKGFDEEELLILVYRRVR
jgi:uncharacterized protein (TIGR03067 family)